MDLNLCLYCEKRLADDSIAFCSLPCQTKEAAKSMSLSSVHSNNTTQYDPYQISYHRSPSLTYPINVRHKDIPDLSIARPSHHYLTQSMSTSSSSFSSSLSDMSTFSYEDKVDNLCSSYHITCTTHNIAP
ncbi:hypothetical protein BD560DRAFT_404796 [Blakeslea trispora]|nr:hypothetical protein BD560DRAFT_404796 [Blakeslea trispora]